MMASVWKIWVDTGGTFTDCIAKSPGGETKRLKVLSSSLLRVRAKLITEDSLYVSMPLPVSKNYFKDFTVISKTERRKIVDFDPHTNIIILDRPFNHDDISELEITSNEEVPVFASRLITETALSESFPQIEMKLGSTRGTNALLERKGARTLLIVTKGFRDLLLIGNQQREQLFALNVVKREPVYADVIEVNERIASDGSVIIPLTQDEIHRAIDSIHKKKKFDAIAIGFVNSYRNAAHENVIREALINSGYTYISCSHALSAQIKILPRVETAVVNSYLDPIIDSYLSTIRRSLASASLKVMSSAGGLLEVDDFKPKDSLLSGPAGGVVGALERSKRSGADKIITFDMGGTSTDVSRCDGRPDYRFDCTVGNLKILSPSLSIETIAAGGGSICDFDGYRLLIGPHSAGASPGPACYGQHGPLTITDVNLLLGRIDPDSFSIPLRRKDAEHAFDKLRTKLGKGMKAGSREELLQSLIDIANEKMAEAIRKISIQQGHDPKAYALVCFGGAGGQHACALASLLDIEKILIPYDAGLLSAYGIGNAKIERIHEQLVLKPLREVIDNLELSLNKLYNDASASILKNDPHALIRIENQFIFLRLKGQETSLEIQFTRAENIAADFVERYKKVYGHYLDQREIEVESIRLIVSSTSDEIELEIARSNSYKPSTEEQIAIYSAGGWATCALYRWEKLKVGATFNGPALLTSENSTVFIEKGWLFTLDEHQNAILSSARKSSKTTARPDAALLELFTNRFTSLVEEMGTLLQRTSFSVNVKERLDFSCALLDAQGNLVVNAPHIPVHLGSLGVCVRTVMKHIDMREGDVVITNHPAFGGSHLPDITLIKPVFYRGKLACFMVNRAHHAEIGGKKPGSMPADATSLEEEGVIISPSYLLKRGKARWKEIEHILTSAKYPTRALEENLADLNAALAALTLGESSFKQLCSNYGFDDVNLYMLKLRQHAASLIAAKIKTLKPNYKASERLDDGSILKVSIERKRNLLHVDFTGTASVHKGNLNATKAIINSVVLYVMRLLIDKPVPLNEGLLKPIKLIIPHGLLNPVFFADNFRSPAVVGGNTEVSQRLTDTLLKAFGLAACSQGTMNNLLFGNDRFGYYETICGGVGAGPSFHGADAVHQHMTNTRITDPEILESRYPVILQRFEIRKNAGGTGRWTGGNGIIRELKFLETLEVNILSQHRDVKPFGMKGGQPGKVGEQYLVRDDKKIMVKGIDGFTVRAGDTLVIKTPGGGGWGIKGRKKG